MKFSLVFQNIDGDGLPTLGGDIVGTVESPKDKGRLVQRIRSFHPRARGIEWRFAFPTQNYRMALAWLNGVFKADRPPHIVPVHGAGRRPPTPRRDFLVQTGDLNGWPTTLIEGHAVNSAWAPKRKPTTWRKRRRALWWAWWNVLVALLERHHNADRLVILVVDGNRPGKYAPPGMVEVAGDGPQRIFVTKDHPSRLRVVSQQKGPHTGDGRVTHPSHRIVFEIDRWRPHRVSP